MQQKSNTKAFPPRSRRAAPGPTASTRRWFRSSSSFGAGQAKRNGLRKSSNQAGMATTRTPAANPRRRRSRRSSSSRFKRMGLSSRIRARLNQSHGNRSPCRCRSNRLPCPNRLRSHHPSRHPNRSRISILTSRHHHQHRHHRRRFRLQSRRIHRPTCHRLFHHRREPQPSQPGRTRLLGFLARSFRLAPSLHRLPQRRALRCHAPERQRNQARTRSPSRFQFPAFHPQSLRFPIPTLSLFLGSRIRCRTHNPVRALCLALNRSQAQFRCRWSPALRRCQRQSPCRIPRRDQPPALRSQLHNPRRNQPQERCPPIPELRQHQRQLFPSLARIRMEASRRRHRPGQRPPTRELISQPLAPLVSRQAERGRI